MKGTKINYTKEELDWVKKHCTLVVSELHEQFSQTFGRTDVSANNLHALRKRNGWKTGRTGHFRKGHTGLGGGPGGPNATSFKKGNIPPNAKPLYTERTTRDGYTEIKVPKPNPYTNAKTRYRLKHLWVWENAGREIPAGHALIFKDGNKKNCNLDNLVCVPRSVLLLANRHLNYSEYPPELKETIINIARVQDASFKKIKQPSREISYTHCRD
ncbi:hypothetical protein TDB9533_01269 [Thalassocella blandensis]|nr:hypothetical protein TDB9533_01269 [Thalassocella blandensis]